ncbi:MAG: rhodanese-like domain-containing protein [Actinomycetota bacterium]|nr:rhodanese-like domain-containing protein [Actinomycetota bacterium]
MSPRAAWRLARLGFSRVYDYEAGKMDWLSYGLPDEGSALLADDILDRSVPTCDLDVGLSKARRRAAEDGGGFCVAGHRRRRGDGDPLGGCAGGPRGAAGRGGNGLRGQHRPP